jgi:Uncharacterized protein conserved in bacteria
MALLAVAALIACAHAEDYPARPITMIVGFPPGGSTDATARILQDPLSQALGQSIVIDNRGGAGGTTGAAAVANARPDGYTLLFSVNAALTMNMYLQKSFPFDTLKAFAPITIASDVVLVLVVNAALPVKTVPELIEYAKHNPGKLAYGSSGVGSGHHICGELMNKKPASTWCTCRTAAARQPCRILWPATFRSRSERCPRCCRMWRTARSA